MQAQHQRTPNMQTQQQQQRTQPTATLEVQEPSIRLEPTICGKILRQLFQIIFYIQLCLVTSLILVLTVRGLIYSSNTNRFHPKKWYLPLLVSIASAGIVSLIWQSITFHSPSNAIKAAFVSTPMLTCAFGVLHVLIGSPVSLAACAVSILSGAILSLYACCVRSRFDYASEILKVSTSVPPDRTIAFVILSIMACLGYSTLSVAGIGGATATGTFLDAVFILIILLSFTWTMQVIKNMLCVTISKVRYMNFASRANVNTCTAFCDTIKHLVGSVCIGSAMVPVIGTIRGSSRAINLAAGGNDEFMFSLAHCYAGFSSTLITYGNRWAFVHVGVYNKGFIQASSDTWDMFKRVELIPLIDSDLTGVFCFLSGVAVGSICGIIGGTWELIIHQSYATEVSIYAFLIGYFMCRIALAWQQACVSAYYVAYGENPESARFDATIPVRVEQLQRLQRLQVLE